MVHFVGAGSGAADLITLRGKNLLERADVVIYAGSLVNPELLSYTRQPCEIHNSAYMILDEVIKVMQEAEKKGKMTVRLHTGDPSIYGAVREQMDELKRLNISYDICPGVSSLCGAAASLKAEYTLPGVSQSLIITRMSGRIGVKEDEAVHKLAAHHATMVIFLSAGLLKELTLEFFEKFEKKLGSINCAKLKEMHRTEKEGCNKVIYAAGEILDEIVMSELKIKK